MAITTATELKSNFKVYAKLASDGEVIIVRRPKNEPGLVLINEKEYEQLKRTMEYYTRLKEDIIHIQEDEEKIVLTKKKKHLTLEQRISMKGQPIVHREEMEWGELLGRELL